MGFIPSLFIIVDVNLVMPLISNSLIMLGTPRHLEPRTCATFSVLHQFHVLNLQAKTTSYDFYKVLSLLTDASGCEVLIHVSDHDPRLSLWTDSAKKDSTSAQLASIHKQQTALLRWLQCFCKSQMMFMPGLLDHLNFVLHLFHSDKPEPHPLHLPSTFTDPVLWAHICISGLANIRDHLCEAHTTEALEDLCCQLRMRALANSYKKSNIQSQGPYTQLRTLQRQVEDRIVNACD